MKLLVIDGNSIINRAFYGIRILSAGDGIYTNGIYGFINIYQKLCAEVQPDAVAVCFDLKAPTFRHKMFDGYKAKRKPTPPELLSQFPLLKELLHNMGVKTIELEGYEADDLIGTLALSCENNGDNCFIATGDRDSLQLVNGLTKVLLASTQNGHPVLNTIGVKEIQEKYGVKPYQLIDVKAIQGDASDNIPGVAGIGEKGALDLIQRFGSLEYIYQNIENIDIKPGIKTKLEASKDMAFLSYKLGTICTSAPISTDINTYIPRPIDKQNLAALLRKLKFKKFLEEWELDSEIAEDSKEPTATAAEIVFEQADNNLLLSLKQLGIVFWDNKIFACYENRFSETDEQTLLKIINSNAEIYTNDSKALFAFGLENGINKINVSFDTSLAGYLLDPSRNSYSLFDLVNEYEVRITVKNEDASYVYGVAGFTLLCEKMITAIKAQGLTKLMFDIELPLARVLANMEHDGFLCDVKALNEYGKTLSAEIQSLCDEIYALVGYEFNLNSPKQLGEALFVKLGLKGSKKTKSGYSTDAATLDKLKNEHPAVELLLKYRTLAKLKSTYCDGLEKVADQQGRIHSTFNQTETRTGRISSSEPNLQNIPVRKKEGKILRKFFTAKEGCLLVDADYSQIELRVLAHIADDKNMIDAFTKGEDIHTSTAAKVFNMPKNMVTPVMRSRAKAVNFGIVYGIGAYSLAQDISISYSEAKSYIQSYYDTYEGVKNYMDMVVESSREKGYCETLFARRRYLPELSSSNGMTRSFGERVARNAPIQGTAADIIKIAMIKVFERLEKENMKSRLILQVHDELIVEAPENEAEKAAQIVKEEMQNAVSLKVALEADVHIGKNWFEAKE